MIRVSDTISVRLPGIALLGGGFAVSMLRAFEIPSAGFWGAEFGYLL